jgi:hypothetical protein
MNMLANLTTDDTIADEKDSVGGGGVLDSGIYAAKIAMAYLTKASSGALGLVLDLKTEAGKNLKQTLWMTSGTAKGCKNYYEKDGEKHYLPGFLHANALALLTVGKEISQLETENKVVNVYSYEAKAEVPTKVDVLMDLLNQEIIVGVIKQTVDKTKKNEATGVYEPTGETREENDIDKLFRASDRMTTAEIRAQAETATFIETWSNKWTGQVKNKAKGAQGTAGAPKAAAGAPAAAKKPTTSLFAA